ncbi:anti-phage dCTP deaminase [Undibacterium parvum]|nr:anti-phage dCTP deaminase [Undibacterium parvum]AZP11818.1 deoxycytidylate deaminase [Undibacterium parvum]
MALVMAKAGSSSKKNSMEKFYTDEIVIGLCGPIGVDLPLIAVKIIENLRSYNYDSEHIKMSKLIGECNGDKDDTGLERKRRLIQEGNALREKNERGSFLAEKAIEKIFESRATAFPDGKFASRRVCFIIDSIKNTSEAKKFREIYGDSFYLISVFSANTKKIENLTRGADNLKAQAKQIIEDDFNQKGEFGQQVSKVFQTADYFFRLDGAADADGKVQRLFKLIFGAEIITPEKSETAMYSAASAARNSACLSRQVGAAIIDADGDVISTGWNDVPKFGGGTYRFGEVDNRCFNSGKFCRNDQEKNTLISSIVDELIDKGVVDGAKKSIAYQVIEKSKVSDLIEFSRAVHAEMLAILNAAKSSSGQLKNAVLYCTTYPCHSCARHIVAAGIKEVYFIEPYAKSKAVTLHSDSITEDENDSGKLRILAYEGVAPSRFLDFFSIKKDRKFGEGEYKIHPKIELKPQVDKMFEAVHVLEAIVVDGLSSTDGDDDGNKKEIPEASNKAA